MMKKIWKNRSGVSPVIATILMVAITVVLAAVLYVMVMGFGGEWDPHRSDCVLEQECEHYGSNHTSTQLPRLLSLDTA